MCNYCNVTKNRIERMIKLESKLKKGVHCIAISIEKFNDKAYLAEYVNDEKTDISNIFAVQISYCPMCGRQLDE